MFPQKEYISWLAYRQNYQGNPDLPTDEPTTELNDGRTSKTIIIHFTGAKTRENTVSLPTEHPRT